MTKVIENRFILLDATIHAVEIFASEEFFKSYDRILTPKNLFQK